MKKLVFTLMLVSLFSSVFAVGVFAQSGVPTVCYLSGNNMVEQGVQLESFVYDPVTFEIYSHRIVYGGESDLYNAFTPVLVPVTAVEELYYDGFFFGYFEAANPLYQLPLSDCVGSRIGDGRINDGPDELGAPLAAYCADGSIEVWEIDTEAQGTLGFTASGADIDAGLSSAAASGLPTLIDSGLGNSLYASPEGELVVLGPDLRDASKTYQFAFSGTRCG